MFFHVETSTQVLQVDMTFFYTCLFKKLHVVSCHVDEHGSNWILFCVCPVYLLLCCPLTVIGLSIIIITCLTSYNAYPIFLISLSPSFSTTRPVKETSHPILNGGGDRRWGRALITFSTRWRQLFSALCHLGMEKRR